MGLGRDMRRVSRKGEEQTAAETGGRRQPASGATDRWKGDTRSDTLLIERKDTAAKQYTLKIADLDKLRLQALAHDREPVFQVCFVGGRSYAILDWQFFLTLNSAIAPEIALANVPQHSPAPSVRPESFAASSAGPPRPAKW
jgi:hypothetical protein